MLDFVNTKSPYILGVCVWPGFQLKVEGMNLQMEGGYKAHERRGITYASRNQALS